MTCIRTGADIWLVSHGAVVHGDLFQIDDVFALNSCGEDTWDYPHDGQPIFVNMLVDGDFETVGKVLIWKDEACSEFHYEKVEL